MKAEELRRSVLQLAVEGKLVEQRPEEGTAKELLAEIAAERERLVREGKMKKGKPLPPVSSEEMPFEIPESWEWVRLGEVANRIHYGFTASAQSVGNCQLLRITDIQNDSVNWQNVPSCNVTKTEFEAYGLHPNDILIARTGGTVGKSYLVQKIPDRSVFASYLIRIILTQKIEAEYIKKYFSSSCYWDQLFESITGTGQPNVNGQALQRLYLPLPPLAEQRRIVARLGELMPLIDAYDAEERRLSALETEFPEQLRRSLLQYAVEGKLVEQRPGEGTARELLLEIAAERERLIRAGRMKRSKPLAPVSPDEVPFKVPESWEWVRLGEIINLVSGQHIETSNYNTEGKGIAYLTGPADFGTKITVITRWTEHPKVIVEKNSILITVKGAGVGKTNILSETAAISRQLMAIMPIGIFDAYVLIFLKYYESAISNMKSGTTIPGISREDILGISLPLPPLAEQRRIVARLEELMPLIDTVRNKNTVSSEGGL